MNTAAVTEEGSESLQEFACFQDAAYWEAVDQAKSAWIVDGTDPRADSRIRPDIAESWVMAHELHLSMLRESAGGMGKDAAFASYVTTEDDEMLVAAASPIFESYLGSVKYADCTLELFNAQSVLLLGRTIRKKPRASKQGENQEDRNNQVQNLKCRGVLAHTMAMYTKKPFIMVGPESFWSQFDDTVGYAAPIMSDEGQVLGAILFARELGADRSKMPTPGQCIHTLGWVSALAASIGRQISYVKSDKRLNNSYRELRNSNALFRSALNLVADPIMVVSSTNAIIDLNGAAEMAFRIGRENRHLYNLLDVLDDVKIVKRALASNAPVSNLRVSTHAGGERRVWSMTLRPVDNAIIESPRLFMLHFTNSETVGSAADGVEGALRSNKPISMEEIEQRAIRASLERTNYNVALAAAQLGMSRSTFYRKMQKYNINTD